MPGGAVRRRADRPDPLALGLLGVHAVRGQVRRQVGAHRDRADARAAAAVRDAEGLVQVEVRDVAAELARLGVAEQRVEVGAVDVDLAAVVVDDLAQVGDGVLVGAVRRRVGHHDRGQVVGVRLALGAQVVEVDRPVVGGLDHHHPHAGHHRRRGVGAVRGGRDQADVAAGVAVGPVVAADREQTRPARPATRRSAGSRPGRSRSPRPATPRAGRPARRSRSASSAGANGCRSAKPGSDTGSISVVALSFIVQEPSGIIPRSSA